MDPSVRIVDDEMWELTTEAYLGISNAIDEARRFVACLTLFNVRDRQPHERPNPKLVMTSYPESRIV